MMILSSKICYLKDVLILGYASQLGTFSVTIKKRFISLAIPILICSVLSGICSWLLFGYFNTDASGGQGAPAATFIPGDNVGPALANAAIYVGIAFVGAFGIFFIFKLLFKPCKVHSYLFNNLKYSFFQLEKFLD